MTLRHEKAKLPYCLATSAPNQRQPYRLRVNYQSQRFDLTPLTFSATFYKTRTILELKTTKLTH